MGVSLPRPTLLVAYDPQVYDTTLDISLAEDQTKWLDDFGLKGPSPDGNRLSWDKSPVANGAHYFL